MRLDTLVPVLASEFSLVLCFGYFLVCLLFCLIVMFVEEHCLAREKCDKTSLMYSYYQYYNVIGCLVSIYMHLMCVALQALGLGTASKIWRST